MANIIIFATSHLPLIGGSQIAVHEITRRLPNHNFHLLCPRLKKGLASRENIGAVQISRLGLGISVDKFLFPLIAPFYVKLRLNKPSLIWAMLANYGGLGALFYKFINLNKAPLLLSLQEGGTYESLQKLAGPFFFLFKLIIKKADAIQAISKYLLEIADKCGTSAVIKKVIPNGVDIELFRPCSRKSLKDLLPDSIGFRNDDLVLFTASRLSEKNAIGDIISAMPLLPIKYKFLIAGSGHLESRLKQMTSELHLDGRVHFLGDCTQARVAELLPHCHLFVRPSIREGLGNSFLEAMASGTPIIATMVGGIKDFLINNINGIEVIPNNPISIAEGVRAYEDVNLYNAIQKNGLELVRCKFNWDNLAKRMGALFDDTIQLKCKTIK